MLNNDQTRKMAVNGMVRSQTLEFSGFWRWFYQKNSTEMIPTKWKKEKKEKKCLFMLPHRMGTLLLPNVKRHLKENIILTALGSATNILEIKWRHSGEIWILSGIEYWTLKILCMKQTRKEMTCQGIQQQQPEKKRKEKTY